MSTPRRLLLVGDDAAELARLRGLLADGPYDVETIGDDAAPLDSIRARQPALVLLAAAHADDDARQLCRRIKDDPALRGTAVLMLLESGGLGAIERAVAAGADDFILHPVDGAELRRRVAKLLRNGDARS